MDYQLTLEIEKEIRSYLMKILIPVSTVLAAVGFLIGFIISEYAEIVAISEGQNIEQKALERIDNIANDTQKRLLDVSQKLYSDQQEFTKSILSEQSKARETLNKIKTLAKEATELDKKVSQLKAIENAQEVINGVTSELKNDKDFKNEITSDVLEKSTQLEEKLAQLEITLLSRINEIVSVRSSSVESGLVDLAGKYRIQWGEFKTVTEQKPIIFPAPFGNDNPIVVASTKHLPTSKYRGRPVNIENLNSTSFKPAVAEGKYTTLSVECMYIAIGHIPVEENSTLP